MKHCKALITLCLFTSLSLLAMEKQKPLSAQDVRKDIRTCRKSPNEEEQAQAFVRLFVAASEKKRTPDEQPAHQIAKKYVDKRTGATR